MHKEGSIVVVGAGVFGLSTALKLKRRGYGDITVLDRHLPPVPDGSSVDISRIVNRIMQMSSMLEWVLKPLRSGRRNNSHYSTAAGFFVPSPEERCKATLWSYTEEEATERYPGIHGDLFQTSGYCNLDAGWADTAGCIKHLASICEKASVNFLSGERGTVTELISADAAGRQTITGYMKLAPEEAVEMQGGPVMINLSTGWFAFPPTDDHTLKMARHGYGFETTHTSDSTRYSAPSVAFQSDYLPADAEQALRDGLALFLPRFRDRP
ncbi:hypothetical protein E4T47_04524 [Aureobasidium subglaciale]|nr:hypothetical protein E4T47_04524 [Aureobasidium subglaciale]